LSNEKQQIRVDICTLLGEILKVLNDEHVPHVVMRNYSGYPQKISGDVDLVIPRSHFAKARSLLLDCAARGGWGLFMESSRPYVKYLGLVTDGWPQRSILVIEFFDGGTWYCLPFLDAGKVVGSRRQTGETWAPRGVEEAILTMIHHLLWNKTVPEKYRDNCYELVKKDVDTFLTLLAPPFGNGVSRRIVHAVLNQDWRSLDSLASTARARLVFTSVVRAPFKTFRGVVASALTAFTPVAPIEVRVEANEREWGDEVVEELMNLADEWHIGIPGKRHNVYGLAGNAKRGRCDLWRARRGGGVVFVSPEIDQKGRWFRKKASLILKVSRERVDYEGTSRSIVVGDGQLAGPIVAHLIWELILLKKVHAPSEAMDRRTHRSVAGDLC